MPYAVVTTFVNGNVMSASDVQAELARIRAWKNGALATADFGNRVVMAKHLFKPEYFKFAGSEMRGATVQDVYFTGLHDSDHEYRTKLGRQDIHVHSLRADETCEIVRAAKTIYIPTTSTVDVSAWWTYVEAHSTTGTAYPCNAGDIRICRRAVSSNAVTSKSASNRRLIGRTSVAPTMYNLMGLQVTGARWSLTTGWWDIYLRYDGANNDATVHQVLILNCGLLIEVRKD